ncbi:MAG: LPXTG-site transpeptidase (sortase) family protein [Candidatus Saccharimonadales bacterium]|jgi:LPXTG-site transpeptidase (sortase) family protein
MTKKASKVRAKDDSGDLPIRRRKVKEIKPLHAKELKNQLKKDSERAQSNADVLAELAAKTAELASQVKGPESPIERVLELDDTQSIDQAAVVASIITPGTPQVPELVEPIIPKITKRPAKSADPALNLIRDKLNRIYSKEPDAEIEAAEAIAVGKNRSTHQEFMYQLTTSGKALAQIQTEWHNYYVELSDDDKHEVWQEFYKDQHTTSSYARHRTSLSKAKEPQKTKPSHSPKSTKHMVPGAERKSVAAIKSQIHDTLTAGGRLRPIHHVKSLLFGMSFAGVVAILVGFVFFNQIFIAPFISPSKTVSATPIIGNSVTAIGPEHKIIIPKINLEVPVVFDLGSVQERAIQDALEEGVVHYSSSPEPGEIGNSVIVGHSSNNILNSGKYKFAFVLLKRLEVEDTFFVQKDGVRYTYKIFEKKIVPPTDTSVLRDSSRDNTMTLITCDPPGTSINRLIIVAEQISPDPSGNIEATIEIEPQEDEQLPSNSQSFWSRITSVF